MKRKFKYETIQFNDGDSFPFVDFADATFVNKGTATININGFPLATGEAISDTAFGDEVNASNYRITQVGAGTWILFVRVKIYLN